MATRATDIISGRKPLTPAVKLTPLRQYTTKTPMMAYGNRPPNFSINAGVFLSPEKAKKGKKLKGLAIAGIAISATGFVICIILIIWAAYVLSLAGAGAQMATILPLIV
jgi:hypothetical protein